MTVRELAKKLAALKDKDWDKDVVAGGEGVGATFALVVAVEVGEDAVALISSDGGEPCRPG